MRKYIFCILISIISFCACIPKNESIHETEAPYCTVLPTIYQTEALTTPTPYQSVIMLTEDNFDNCINSNIPIVVDFWLDLCGHCQEFEPIIEELAKHSDGSYIVSKLNIKDYPLIRERYNIFDAPTIIIFKNGEIIYQHTGMLSVLEIISIITNL